MKFTDIKILALVIVFGLTMAIYGIAADSANVTATVTAQNLEVTVTDAAVAYGTIGLSSTSDTTNTAAPDDSQTATNAGNVTADLNIRGANSTSAGAGWTLGAAAGSETYRHDFCKTTCDVTPTWTALTAVNQTLALGVAASGTQIFDLKIHTPTATTDYNQQTVSVTVQATAP